LEQTLNALFKQNFNYIYENLQQIGLEITKLNSKIVNNVIFNFLQNEEYEKLLALITQLRSVSYQIESKDEEFFEMMFWK